MCVCVCVHVGVFMDVTLCVCVFMLVVHGCVSMCVCSSVGWCVHVCDYGFVFIYGFVCP